jgi:hypothetical protein
MAPPAQDTVPSGAEAPVRHGERDLPSVRVDAYGTELHDPAGRGFLSGRITYRAFVGILEDWILEDWRARVPPCGRGGGGPLTDAPGGAGPAREIGRDELDALLAAAESDPEAAGRVQSVVDDFAYKMAAVARRLLRLPAWRGTERVAVGGGFLEARIGPMAVGRLGALLTAGGEAVRLTPVSRRPGEAALCGAAHLAPPEALHGCDAILAADLGGADFRAGLVALGLDRAPDLSRARTLATERWRHADGRRTARDAALARLAGMLRGLARRAEGEGLGLAPFVGVACPGVVLADGTIERGGQDLPGGGWEGGGFNLPERLREALPDILGRRPVVAVHNDAVAQGLSEAPAMRDVQRWGVLTVGTGFGNARFSNRS